MSGTTPQLMRALNQRTVYDGLQRLGSASRAELARRTGLSKPTISLAVADLERAGMVRPAGQKAPAGAGRTSLLYEPDPTAGYVLGLDIGRRWIRSAIADLSGQLLGRADLPQNAATSTGLLELARQASTRAQASAGISADQIAAAFLGGPGVPDRPSRRHRYAPNVPGWSEPGVLDQLAEVLDCPLETDNDVACATIAEAAQGAAVGESNFVYLWIGSGIGLGIWIDGRLYRGQGSAGEVGFIPLAAATGTDNSQLSPIELAEGLVERAISADGILRAAQAVGLREGHTAKDVFALAAAGNRLALEVVQLEGKRIAHVVAAVVAVLDPGLLVLGGAIGRSADQLTGPLGSELARLTPLRPRIVGAQLGDDAVLLGAVAAALDAARQRVFADRMGARPDQLASE
ncbi:MAG TPA: ROK family protein [Streptosporangiaceae bacterium]|nr:ROK family protein [Streptosporangiaceae bacterium]